MTKAERRKVWDCWQNRFGKKGMNKEERRKVRKAWFTVRRIDGGYIHFRCVNADRARNIDKAFGGRIPKPRFYRCDKIIR